MATLVAAILLSLAYPPTNQHDIAFFALVPLLIVLRLSSPRRAFFLGWIFGFLFRILNLSWLSALSHNGGPLPLVFLALFGLSAYCALFTGLFAFTTATTHSFFQKFSPPRLLLAILPLFEALFWVGSEYLVSTFLSGFPWNPLAASQIQNLPLLSCTSLFGAYALSAIILAVNSGIAALLLRLYYAYAAPRFLLSQKSSSLSQYFSQPSASLFVALILLTISWWKGIDSVKRIDFASSLPSAPHLQIALIHPNAACIFERYDEEVLAANNTLSNLTEFAAATKPDLIVWPETSLPGYFPYDASAAELVAAATQSANAPLIAGCVEYEQQKSAPPLIYNSAVLFFPGPFFKQVYRKQHLVPFGEFIPLESKIPALKKLAPTGFSCEPGSDIKLFPISSSNTNAPKSIAQLAPLICFEDVFPYLSRRAALKGASILTMLINDAWFSGSAEPEQHLAQAILRATETQLPVIRATNQGISSFILPNGRIIRQFGGKNSPDPGFISSYIPFSPTPTQTFYTRHGDSFFAIPCATLLLGTLFASALFHARSRLFK